MRRMASRFIVDSSTSPAPTGSCPTADAVHLNMIRVAVARLLQS